MIILLLYRQVAVRSLIVKFLKYNLEETHTLNDLCKGLLLWEQISPFLVITAISDIDKH